MSGYSIKDLETLSGIKAHTIRIWEKRYDLLHPERTDTNIRLYSDDDLKALLNVALLNKSGFKISKIADMTNAEICRKVENLSARLQANDLHIDRLVVDMIELREDLIESRLSSIVADLGVVKALTHVIYPFLERIGVLWQIGSIVPAQEHFISNLIRNTLISEITRLPMNWNSKVRFVLFLPANELHEIGLLAHYYILKELGYYVIYLGQNVPYGDLKSVIKTVGATHTLSSHINAVNKKELNKSVEKLASDFPQLEHYITGVQAIEKYAGNYANVSCIHSLDHFQIESN